MRGTLNTGPQHLLFFLRDASKSRYQYTKIGGHSEDRENKGLGIKISRALAISWWATQVSNL
jgi:hypothetical protein